MLDVYGIYCHATRMTPQTTIDRQQALVAPGITDDDRRHPQDVCQRAVEAGGELGEIGAEIYRISAALDALTTEVEQFLRAL